MLYLDINFFVLQPDDINYLRFFPFQIQDATGARVNFKDEVPNDIERIVVIRGTPEGAQQAEVMVRKVVAEAEVEQGGDRGSPVGRRRAARQDVHRGLLEAATLGAVLPP